MSHCKMEIESLKHDVWVAARDGHASKILSLLWDVGSHVEEILSHKTHGTTPLICAVCNGNDGVVAVLLNFGVDLEEKGTVVHYDETFRGVTALWCASNWCYFNIVKLLVDHGANVNSSCEEGSSPLKRACYYGGYRIAQCLVEHGADVNSTDNNGNTCLMGACYSGKYQVVEYLLKLGADPARKTFKGLTALHFSAAGGRVAICHMLVEPGLKSMKDNDGRTPMMLAALQGQKSVVEYFISLNGCGRKDHVDALDLLGTSFLFKTNPDIRKAYDCFNTAMYERYKIPDQIVQKHRIPTSSILAITEKEECTTLNDLDEIREDDLALCIEGMHILERVLDTRNADLYLSLMHTGSLFADNGDYYKCIDLWIYASNLCQEMDKEFDVTRFAELFARMLHAGFEVNFRSVLLCFQAAERQLKFNKNRIQSTKGKLRTGHDTDIMACIYLIGIMLQTYTSKEEEYRLNREVYNFLQTKPQLQNGHGTPLHICCNSESNDNKIKMKNEIVFPDVHICKVLVACGANVNAQDSNNDTPLHLLARCNNHDSNILSEMISCLIENGAHLDACNKDGYTAVDGAYNCIAASIIKTHMHMNLLSLKCLSARAVMDHRVEFEGIIPDSLKEFVELH